MAKAQSSISIGKKGSGDERRWEGEKKKRGRMKDREYRALLSESSGLTAK